MDYELINNESARQYEFNIDGLVAKIVYNRAGDKIYLVHTDVPKELGGRGIASLLVRKVLEDIQENGLKLIPLCPFIKKYIQRNPAWESLVFND